ncbi:probable bifunctional dTTP/UTP pyrophosphatase/methyltransferase protein isoform X1 [Esox lucius]|nr:probable bifunctional dTTP/UTP pyrophosphatase/methyltransferase protein isoform X1 [Esox lucius]XP_010903994.2 probable bifunctional dTTP/UTP pyrophosphatase/methyltransferase protein isoform X1 [Esox lucius]
MVLMNPVISKLTGKLVVLASSSPRRLEILTNVGLRFEVVPSWFKETLDKRLFETPHEYAVENAKLKALEVAKRMPYKHLKTPDIVIGADTVVTVDGLILEKPVDKQDAYRMLSRLSGKEHSVFTGVAIILCHEKKDGEINYQVIDFYEETKVKFANLSDDLLWEYINSGEPMDKAGGYGIQALGGMLVEYVHGDFLNVVGFPLNHFCKKLGVIFSPPNTLGLSPQGSLTPNGSQTRPVETASSVASSPSATQAYNSVLDSEGQHSPSASPVHKVKQGESAVGGRDAPQTLVSSLSKCSENGEVKHLDNSGLMAPGATNKGTKWTQNANHSEKDDCIEGMRKMTELIDGFKASKALFTASELHVFDMLRSSKTGELQVEDVAREIKASVKGTERLLEACVSLGLLQRKGKEYTNSELSRRFLLSDASYSLQGYIQHCNEMVWPLFSYLESAVKEGTNQHEKAFGKTSDNLFQDTYYSRNEVKLRFMKAMHSIAIVSSRDVAMAFDLSQYTTACDLGGCTGAMAYEFVKVHPGLSVTVFDLPEVIEMSDHFRPHDADNRVSFVAGDFFKDELPKADIYILARILHDWSDEKVHILLSKISKACSSGGCVLVSEIFLDEDRTGPGRGLLQALSMTEGIQRSASEYSFLLKSQGFTTTHVKHTHNILDAMLCVKEGLGNQ